MIMTRGISGSYALAALLLAVAWAAPHEGPHGGHSESHFHHLHHGPEEPHSHEESCHSYLSPPNADFAFHLYKQLSAKAGARQNIFYSPLGISTALSMLSTGAAGDTHSQLLGTLGYTAANLSQAQVNVGYEHLLHMLGHAQHTQQLAIGNALALSDSFKPLVSFLEDLKHFYASEGFSVDFSKPAEAVEKINKYISDKTHGLIKDQLKDLDPLTVMVLINYVYFRGKWEKPFDATLTQKADFHVDNVTTVQVDMMMRHGEYYYYEDHANSTQVILLLYKGNSSMMIVLPYEGKMSEVEGYITKDHIKHWHDKLLRRSVDLFLPKFSISAEASLDETLKALGITSAFEDIADFSGISREKRLKISKVSHKAVLSVDETGTEAAAATTIEITSDSLPDTVNLDRPFLVFILEHYTKSILFMGKITDPTAH